MKALPVRVFIWPVGLRVKYQSVRIDFRVKFFNDASSMRTAAWHGMAGIGGGLYRRYYEGQIYIHVISEVVIACLLLMRALSDGYL